MSAPTAQIYLVAGASRGLGLALVNAIASKDPSTIIYAGARDPSGAQLKDLAGKYPGRIEIVKYVAGDKEGNDVIATEIKRKYGRVDTVIANAGIGGSRIKVHETPAETFQEYFSINTLGPIVLFQSSRDLLKASSLPRFITISSGGGSLGLQQSGPGLDLTAYGTSKAALNWVTRKIHFENEWLVAFPQCPGVVDSDMAKPIFSEDSEIAEYIKSIARSPDVAAGMLVDIFTTSTREKDGGEFHNVEGGRHPW